MSTATWAWSAAASLLQRKKVRRAYIGLKMTATQPGGGRGPREGAFVEMVLPRSPAEDAGFEVEDHILEIDGRKVRHFDEVQTFVRSAKVGVHATLKVRRGDASHTLRVETADIRQLRDNQGQGAPRDGGQRRVIIMP